MACQLERSPDSLRLESLGFLRERSGAITVVDGPGLFANPQSINDGGDIAGFAFRRGGQ
jgi:hypothetical protein